VLVAQLSQPLLGSFDISGSLLRRLWNNWQRGCQPWKRMPEKITTRCRLSLTGRRCQSCCMDTSRTCFAWAWPAEQSYVVECLLCRKRLSPGVAPFFGLNGAILSPSSVVSFRILSPSFGCKISRFLQPVSIPTSCRVSALSSLEGYSPCALLCV
jgi:hypothetical protein